MTAALKVPMQPNLNPGFPPPFAQMDPVGGFQPLCRDILKLEPEVTECVVYGVGGQSQHGIDLLADTIRPDTRIAAQCKCYQKFTERNLRDTCKEFSDDLEYWQERNVRRFVLMVACAVERRGVIELRMEMQQQFMKQGITFELWDGNTLRDKLSPHRAIVERHIRSQEIVNDICGRQQVELTLDGEDLTTLLEQLRLALREPEKNRDLIEELLVKEARTLWGVVSSGAVLGWDWSGEPSACAPFLKILQERSERFIKILALTVRFGDETILAPVVERAMGIIAQWPVMLGTSYFPVVAAVRMYPLTLAVYAVGIIAVDRKKVEYVRLLQQLGWKSATGHHAYRYAVHALELLPMEGGTTGFFQHGLLAGQNQSAPAALSTKRILGEWLTPLFIDFEEAWWCGEFVITLCHLALSENYYLLPGVYFYHPEATDPIERLLTKNRAFLDECFEDVGIVLDRFDVVSYRAMSYNDFQRTRGFWHGALELYGGKRP